MHSDLRYCTTLKTALFQAIEVHDRCPILCLATPRATTEWRMSSCYPCLSIVSSASTAYSIAPDSVGQHCTGNSRLEPSLARSGSESAAAAGARPTSPSGGKTRLALGKRELGKIGRGACRGRGG